jgi:N-acetylglucosamine-6-phosphate deacetylase
MYNDHDTVTVEGLDYRSNKPIRITCRQRVIVQIESLERVGREPQDGVLPLLCPGLVDLQINGFQGYDFNTLPLAEETLSTTTRLLWKEGVTSFYPTVITNSDTAIESAVRSIARACSADQAVQAGIAGIHLEGPFLSPEDGARGAHSLSYVKGPDWSLFCRWQEAAEGRIRLITLSPEWPGAAEFIRKCVDSGVTVSIGHTSAATEQIHEAAAAGASLSTHFGNGAHVLLPRHPNYLWDQLARDEIWTCLIADGFHIPDSVLQVALKVKGEKALLVSDAVSLAGMPAGEYETHIGGKVVLTPEGRLHLASNPKLLAGSVQMLTWGIAHLVNRGICSLADAWEMASIRPATKMGLPTAKGFQVGAPADLVLAEWKHQKVNIVQTYKNGTAVHSQ